MTNIALAVLLDPDFENHVKEVIFMGGTFKVSADFPTGGVIANKSELPQIYETGMGKIKLRGKFEVELGKRKADKDKLVISEIPYTMIGAADL